MMMMVMTRDVWKFKIPSSLWNIQIQSLWNFPISLTLNLLVHFFWTLARLVRLTRFTWHFSRFSKDDGWQQQEWYDDGFPRHHFDLLFMRLSFTYIFTFMHFKSQHSNDTESTSCREFYGFETYGADNYILPELRNVLWLTLNEFPTAVDE